MTAVYTMDEAEPNRIHTGHVEHEELDLSDEELRRLKARAARAVTMDDAQGEPERAMPEDYRAFLDGGRERPSGYDAFLRGEQ